MSSVIRFTRRLANRVKKAVKPRKENDTGLQLFTPSAPICEQRQINQKREDKPCAVEISAVSVSSLANSKLIPNLSPSQRLWNAAYEDIRKDEDTQKLEKAYISVLTSVLGDDSNTSTNNLAFQDPSKRQQYMKTLAEKSLSRIPKFAKIPQEFVNSVEGLKESVSLAIGDIHQAAIPWAGVCVVLQILINPMKVERIKLEGLVYVSLRTEWYCALADQLTNEDNIIDNAESLTSIKSQLKVRIVDLYKVLLLFQMKSISSLFKSKLTSFLCDAINFEDWSEDLQEVKDQELTFQSDIQQYCQERTKIAFSQILEKADIMTFNLQGIHIVIRNIISSLEDDKHEKCLQALYVVDPKNQLDKLESVKEELYTDSYRWILDTVEFSIFNHWDGMESGPCRLLWISGPTGTGKTMLMIGLIRQLRKFVMPSLSYFFLQSREKQSSTAVSMLRSLIWMLIVQHPSLITYIQKQYDNTGPSLFNDGWAFPFLKRIFLAMIKDDSLPPVYLILDALDECDAAKPGRREVIELIENSLSVTKKIKWLISSRPNPDIERELKKLNNKEVIELTPKLLKDPVEKYIDHKMKAFRSERDEEDGYTEEILNEIEVAIHKGANTTFLWVAFAFQELEETHGEKALDRIKALPSDLEGFYDHTMDRIENEKVRSAPDCKKLLRTVFLTYRPVTLSELAVLADLNSMSFARKIVKDCRSFLTIREDMVSLIHQSAKDYLGKKFETRLGDFGIAYYHFEISKNSIKYMNSLRKDIYNVGLLGRQPTNDEIPNPNPLDPIRYSCVHWLDHICEAKDSQIDLGECEFQDGGLCDSFLKIHFLHWLESLSLLGKLSEGLSGLSKFYYLFKDMVSPDSQFFSRIHDMHRFALFGKEPIELDPLQAYVSPLAFSPAASWTRRIFEKDLYWFDADPDVEDDWDACIQTHEFETSNGDMLFDFKSDFSPDGNKIAVADFSSHVYIWIVDVVSGQITTYSSVWIPDSSPLVTIKFWPDSYHITCLQRSGAILTWNSINDTYSYKLPDAESAKNGIFTSFSLCQDGPQQLLSLTRHRIKIWNMSGQCKHMIEYDERQVQTAVLSLDGKRLVVFFYDNEIEIWDVACNTPFKSFKTASRVQGRPTFSSQNHWLAWQLHDQVNVINLDRDMFFRFPETDNFTLKEDSSGLTLISRTKENLVVWNLETNQSFHTIGPIGICGENLIGSADGTIGATSTKGFDGTITTKIWDLTSHGNYHKRPPSITQAVPDARFSSDGKRIYSVLAPPGIVVWDAQTGFCIRKTRFDGQCTCSSDAKKCAWLDMTENDHQGYIKIMEVDTGAVLSKIEIPIQESLSDILLRFVDNNQRILFSSESQTRYMGAPCKTIIFDLNTSRHHIIEGQATYSFSPDGKQITTVSQANELSLWETSNGNLLRVFQGIDRLGSETTFYPPYNSTTLSPESPDQHFMVSARQKYLMANVKTREINPFPRVGPLSEFESFDAAGNLVTKRGLVPRANLQLAEKAQFRGFNMTKSCDWIRWNDKKVFWLPPSMRPIFRFEVRGSDILLSTSKYVLKLSFEFPFLNEEDLITRKPEWFDYEVVRAQIQYMQETQETPNNCLLGIWGKAIWETFRFCFAM